MKFSFSISFDFCPFDVIFKKPLTNPTSEDLQLFYFSCCGVFSSYSWTFAMPVMCAGFWVLGVESGTACILSS